MIGLGPVCGPRGPVVRPVEHDGSFDAPCQTSKLARYDPVVSQRPWAPVRLAAAAPAAVPSRPRAGSPAYRAPPVAGECAVADGTALRYGRVEQTLGWACHARGSGDTCQRPVTSEATRDVEFVSLSTRLRRGRGRGCGRLDDGTAASRRVSAELNALSTHDALDRMERPP